MLLLLHKSLLLLVLLLLLLLLSRVTRVTFHISSSNHTGNVIVRVFRRGPDTAIPTTTTDASEFGL